MTPQLTHSTATTQTFRVGSRTVDVYQEASQWSAYEVSSDGLAGVLLLSADTAKAAIDDAVKMLYPGSET